jgi:hypothetical protein
MVADIAATNDGDRIVHHHNLKVKVHHTPPVDFYLFPVARLPPVEQTSADFASISNVSTECRISLRPD